MKQWRLQRQRGVTLVVALIILILITLLAVTGINLEKSNLQTVGNMQRRNENYYAAQETVEQVISSTRFLDTPDNAILNPCSSNNTKCIDVDGDGKTDITVTLSPTPSCIKAQRATPKVENSDGTLNTQEGSCVVGGDPADLSNDTGSSNSSCWDTTWQIQAQATDAVTQASVTYVQGVTARVNQDSVATSCP